MAITETGVVVTTLQGIQRTYTEQGQALQIVMDGLTPNTAYQATAYCIDNGIQSTSNTESFTTLVAGTIALTRQSMARQGSDYVIVYTYTSTYALSSSVLRVGSTAAAQGVIAGNSITFTISGLTPGDAYIYDVTSIDIYTETDNFQSSFVMPVVNTVEITDTTPTQTSVECELEYTIDGGYTSGWVDYWYGTDDPSTDSPIGHVAFVNGASTCTITGLTAGTSYKFRATITLGDGTTQITSTVVSETTEAGVVTECFYVKNTSNTTGTFTISSNVVANNIQYYNPSMNAWMWVVTVPATITVASGEKLYLRGGESPVVTSGRTVKHFTMDVEHEIGGDIRSLLKWQDFQTDRRGVSTVTAIPNNAFRDLFYQDTTLVRASNALFGNVSIGDISCYEMFRGCTGLLNSPDLSGVSRVGSQGLHGVFYGCSNITVGANLSNVTSVSNSGLSNAYNGCANLQTIYVPNITAWDANKFYSWVYNAGNTAASPKQMLFKTQQLLDECPSGTSGYGYYTRVLA